MNPNKNPHPHITCEIVFISPCLARELIEANTENQRSVARGNLAKIEKTLLNDSFALNGESIIVSDTGRLLNGQHRLLAVVNTRIGIWSVLVKNVPDEYFATIDSGKSRTFNDVCKIAGHDRTHHLATSAQLLAEYLLGESRVASGIPLSHADLASTLEAAPRLSDSVMFVMRTKGIAASRGAWLHYILSERLGRDAVDPFFEKLGHGQMLQSGDPIYQLRCRLIADKSSRSKLPRRELLALLVKAWNAHIDGRSIKQLKWLSTESFPVVSFGHVGRGHITLSSRKAW
jgi:hypothetical protein